MKHPPKVPAKPSKPGSDEIGASDSFPTYLEYNKILRTWFVAFGIGGPALFLATEAISKRLAAAGSLRLISLLFLAGMAIQVLGTLVNKFANLYVYSAYQQVGVQRSATHGLAEWLAGQLWIDALIDVATVALFGYGSWLMLATFAPA